MKSLLNRSLITTILALAFILNVTVALAGKSKNNVVEELVQTDGAQALVAAVLVVDEAEVLEFSLVDLLGDKKAEIVLLAPGNAAFEKLLGLDHGYLNGLTIEEVKTALPSLLPEGVDAAAVAAILLKHVSIPKKANLKTASENALLTTGSVMVADESEFAVGVGASGIQVNYESTIIKADIEVKNGVIHFIDTVIVDELL